jgi:hypothetical protein
MLRTRTFAVLGIAGTILTALPADAAELPARKAGLWEMKISFARSPNPQTMQQCTDAETDKLMHSPTGTQGQENCSKRDVSSSGGQMVVDSVCTLQGRTVTSKAVITGSFESAYVMNITTKSEGGPPRPNMPDEMSMTLEGKWLGPCAADQRPGDVVMPGGMKMNLRDIQNRRAQQGAPGGAPAR